jgi:Flp pilus assembly protein TadG
LTVRPIRLSAARRPTRRSTRRPGRRPARSERGAISVFVALIAAGLLVSIGIVVDLGTRLRAIEQADAYAMEAARAGGQQIDPAEAMSGKGIVVSPGKARTAAQQYLAATGLPGSIGVNAEEQVVHVTVQYRYDTFFLSVIGLGSLTVSGEGSASLVYGVSEPENL